MDGLYIRYANPNGIQEVFDEYRRKLPNGETVITVIFNDGTFLECILKTNGELELNSNRTILFDKEKRIVNLLYIPGQINRPKALS